MASETTQSVREGHSLRVAGITLMAIALWSFMAQNLFADSANRPNHAKAARAALLGLPLSFEANQGQSDSQVKFLSRGDGYSLFLTSNEAVFTLRTTAGENVPPSVFLMELLGANRGAKVSGAEKLPGVANYYLGNNPKKWRSGIETYGKVQYQGIYPGINAVFYGNQRQLEYDFVVAAGADPTQISLGLTGAKPSLDADGNVVLKLADGDLSLKKPVAYQNVDGNKKIIDASYTIAGNKVGFRLGKFDRSQPLVIDPVFTYLTYLGGSGSDAIGQTFYGGRGASTPSISLALDSAGDVYVTGWTDSTNFPLANPYQSTKQTPGTNFWTAFVSALNPSGSALLYSTYLGGSISQGGVGFGNAAGNSIVWDSHDNAVYVVGTTDQSDFPITTGAFQPILAPRDLNGNPVTTEEPNAFVAKFSSSGQLTHSTFLGGTPQTYGFGVATDSLGRAYVVGSTVYNCIGTASYQCFPTTPGAVIPAGTISSNGNGFVSVFDPNLSTLLYSTLLGDPNGAQTVYSDAYGVTVDPNGNFYVVGGTGSPNLPTTPGAFQPRIGTSNGIPFVGFAAKFGPVNANGASLTYLTYLEATGVDFVDTVGGVVADSQGNAYIGGVTGSGTFPVTPGAYQTTCSTLSCAFVTKLNPTGSGLVWSTFLGNADYFGAIQLDSLGNLYVTGQAGFGFPAVNPVEPGITNPSGATGAISKLDPSGSKLLFSSWVGDSTGNSYLSGLAVDALGHIYVAGTISDAGLPTTPGVVQPSFGGTAGGVNGDGYIAKIALETPDLTISKSHTGNFTQGQTGATYSLTVTNSGNGPTSGTVTVTETIPAGLTLVSMSGTGWTCTTLPTCTRTDALANSTSYPPITVTVNVSATAPASVTNIASVSGGGEYNTSNNTANDSTTIVPPPPPSVSTAAATSISGSGATIYGLVNANGTSATVWFEWGTSSTLASFTQCTSLAISGTATTYESCLLTGLTSGTTYYYRIAASNSTGTVKGSILNFTAQARDTSGALQFIAMTPCRVADTRNATGPFGGPALGAKSSRNFVIPSSACGVPAVAAAYSLNVTVVPHGGLGYLTVWPSGQAQPLVSTLNSIDGRIKANAAIVPAGAGGAVSVYVTDATDVVLDINGYFVPGPVPSGLAFYPLTPCRIADTRLPNAPLGGPYLVGGQSRTLPILSSSCQIPSSAQAYSLNFTAVPRGALGFLSAWPAGQTWPGVSTLNAPTATVTANAAIVPAGSNGAINVMSATGSNTDVVIDINGYFAPPAAGGLSLYTVTPCRVLDTRTTTGSFKGILAVDVKDSSCGVPPSAQAFVLNATVVPGGPTLGYLTLWPSGQTQPLVSTLNALDGMVTSNLAIVPTANGSINAFSTDATQLVLDVNGYIAP